MRCSFPARPVKNERDAEHDEKFRIPGLHPQPTLLVLSKTSGTAPFNTTLQTDF